MFVDKTGKKLRRFWREYDAVTALNSSLDPSLREVVLGENSLWQLDLDWDAPLWMVRRDICERVSHELEPKGAWVEEFR